MYVHLVPPSALPGISPKRGEIGWADPLAPTSIVWGSLIYLPISPLVGEMSGRTEGGDAPDAGALCP
ncbi:diaminohydroxyphosphoribosylaminopyrimidine deaminase [Rhizobium esperanzae]|uniref:Diaminohydroxyphosphoribosylaminopyrimidine deaminase n=1 Tax=Rhizobium esperanzae TaxID=1967781 RepID=A0A246DZX6_9HYPH|nr:diaminohydroxyphosphoribosylaminopyrimidine deaminase [Rhizobium esperanzae]